MYLQVPLVILCLIEIGSAGQAPSKPASVNPATPATPLSSTKTQLVVDDVQFAVFDRTVKPTLATINSGSKDTKIYPVDKTKKIQLKFTVKDSKTNAVILVQQAFVAFVNAQYEQEVIFVAEPKATSKVYTAEIDLKNQEKNFDGVDGVYKIRIFVGDSKAVNAIDWNVADVKLTLTPVVKPVPKKSRVINYEPLPVIEHQFREPESRPSQLISDTFTVICAAPLLLLLVLGLSIGINFGNIQISLWAFGFHVGLILIFALYFAFWIQLNMFETLKYLVTIGVPTFISGNRLLRSLNEARRMLSRLTRESRRFTSGNFAVAAGFSEATPKADYAKKPVLITESGVLSYQEFNNRIGQYAAVLSNKLGLAKGDRLIARTSKSVDSLALYFATLRVGAMYIPLNPNYTNRETTHFVNDSKPKILVSCNVEADNVFQDAVKHVICENVLAQTSTKASPILENENVTGADVASVCYTSGTTGLPKGAMITHGGIWANAESCVEAWKFHSNDVQYHVLPSYHIHGLFISLNCSLLTRSSLIWQPKFTVDNALKWLPQATSMMGVPTYFHRLIHDERFSTDTVKNMRVFVSGSAPLSPAVWEDFKKRTGLPILERYGMTETLVSTTNPYEASKRLAGSVGPPLPGYQVRLNKDEVLEYKGPSIFKGYWNLPEKTKQDFTDDGWFITGDVARIDENGFVYIMGRGKDMIISGGLNVYPKEVEDIIDNLDVVQESAVIAAPHPDFGEVVVAVAVKSKAGGALSDEDFEKQLIAAVKKELANYKVPKKVFVLKEMPRNAMGKVQKKQLREEYKNLFVSA